MSTWEKQIRKKETVAPLIWFSREKFIFRRTVRENFGQKLAEASHCWRSRRREACLEWGVHWPATSSRKVCTRMVCNRALSRSVLSQPSLRAPASALDLTRRGHVVVHWLHVVKILHWRQRAGPGHQHCLVVRVSALLNLLGLQTIELTVTDVAILGALPWNRRSGVAAEETELLRPLHRSMLRLLTVEAAEQSESDCVASSFFFIDQPAAAVEPIDAFKELHNSFLDFQTFIRKSARWRKHFWIHFQSHYFSSTSSVPPDLPFWYYLCFFWKFWIHKKRFILGTNSSHLKIIRWISLICVHIYTQIYIYTYPPAPMNHAKIFKGRPRWSASWELVQGSYKTFPPDHIDQVEFNIQTMLSNNFSTA